MSIPEALAASRKAFEADPALALAHFRTDARLGGGTAVAVRMGAHSVAVDEPVSIGGTGTATGPVELALAALGSCQAITWRYWAEILGIRLDAVNVRVETDVDVRGFFGFAYDARPGPAGKVHCTVTVEGPEPPERYRDLAGAVDAHCPVLDVFRRELAVESSLELPG